MDGFLWHHLKPRISARFYNPKEGEMRLSILIIDDEPAIRRGCAATFRRMDVHSAVSAEDGLRAWRENREITFILSDVGLPGRTGVELFEEIRDEVEERDGTFWFMSGEDAHRVPDGMVCISKPFDPEALRSDVLFTSQGDPEALAPYLLQRYMLVSGDPSWLARARQIPPVSGLDPITCRSLDDAADRIDRRPDVFRVVVNLGVRDLFVGGAQLALRTLADRTRERGGNVFAYVTDSTHLPDDPNVIALASGDNVPSHGRGVIG